MILFSYTISGVVMIVIGGFALFHWYLAAKGLTTLEIISYIDPSFKTRSFDRGNWRLNLELVFGKLDLKGFVFPNLDYLPFNGVEWPGPEETFCLDV